MKHIIFFVTLFLAIPGLAQERKVVSEPRYIAVESKDNIFVTREYGLVKITPDGTAIDLSKQDRASDRTWEPDHRFQRQSLQTKPAAPSFIR